MTSSTETYKARIVELEKELATSQTIVDEQIEAAKTQYKKAVKGAKSAAKVANKAILKELKPLRRLVAPEKEKV